MVADGACGIDVEVRRPTRIRRLFPENDLGSRRAANVAKAHKQDSVGLRGSLHGWVAVFKSSEIILLTIQIL